MHQAAGCPARTCQAEPSKVSWPCNAHLEIQSKRMPLEDCRRAKGAKGRLVVFERLERFRRSDRECWSQRATTSVSQVDEGHISFAIPLLLSWDKLRVLMLYAIQCLPPLRFWKQSSVMLRCRSTPSVYCPPERARPCPISFRMLRSFPATTIKTTDNQHPQGSALG
jgi:hypothetical protein